MIKRLTKLICVVLALVTCGGIMCACNKNDDDFRNLRNGEPEAGEFYTLQEAYDNGWLSKGDLRNIAYHKTGDGQRKGFKPTPKSPEILSAETELAIKQDWANSLRKQGTENAVADDVTIHHYYGMYDGLVAIFITSRSAMYLDVIVEKNIGGVKFTYGNSNQILVWVQREK